MDGRYLGSYYPDGRSMEQRLFEAGRRRTKIAPWKWLCALLLGAFFSLIGFLIAIEAFEGFGAFLCLISGFVALVALTGIFWYLSGLRLLERAELLYNTRLAGKTPEDNTISTSAYYGAYHQKRRATFAPDVDDDGTI